MGDPRGFLNVKRDAHKYRPRDERVNDYKDVVDYKTLSEDDLRKQASRCMDCGVPFCHTSCPIGNLMPEFNDFMYNGQWQKAIESLHSTNNFPEFTGRVCPAPCEAGCVAGIGLDPVAIKQDELTIIEKAFEMNLVRPRPPLRRTGKKVAVVGSGPAGLSAADQLNRAGHVVTVFEKQDRVGGLLRYGIPDFKLEKSIVDRRVKLMEREGVQFKTNAHVGVNVSAKKLIEEFDAVCLSGGSEKPRDLPIPGRELNGIHFAMDFLRQNNKRVAGDDLSGIEPITAEGKNVIVIGGGDTGSDCVGTSNRHGAKSITQIELLPKPTEERTDDFPWPTYPTILRTSSSQLEGCDRMWSVMTKEFVGDGKENLKAIKAIKLEWSAPEGGGRPTFKEIPGSEFELPAELVLLAMGFVHPIQNDVLKELEVKLDERGNVATDEHRMSSAKGVFAAGDMRRGQSLVVWAIHEGRETAREIDLYLMGESQLPTILADGH